MLAVIPSDASWRFALSIQGARRRIDDCATRKLKRDHYDAGLAIRIPIEVDPLGDGDGEVSDLPANPSVFHAYG